MTWEAEDRKKKYIYKKMYNLKFLWFPLKLPVTQKEDCQFNVLSVVP
jgi:hypothetical protein